jgi:hypothetical protein
VHISKFYKIQQALDLAEVAGLVIYPYLEGVLLARSDRDVLF